MGSSNGEYGALDTDEARERHDEWMALAPLLGVESLLLDKFLSDKGLDRTALSRVGARWSEPDTLVYLFPDGLKYRSLHDDRRWTTPGATWTQLKLVRDPTRDPLGLIIAEGETDGAALFHRWGADYDVGVLPAGARGLTQGMVDQCLSYDRVLVGLDGDAAGDTGAGELLLRLPAGRRLRPPDGSDWCAALSSDDHPDDPWELTEAPPRVVFTLRELFEADLGTLEDNHWFEHMVLPHRGQLMLHGAVKSLKSWFLIELMRALCTGTPLAGYYDFLNDRPARTLLFQFEVPPFDFRRRMMGVAAALPEQEREAILDNFHVYRLADNAFPRLKMGPDLIDTVTQCASEVEADVILFDPFQRMTGSASVDRANEIDPLLSAFSDLQAAGFTVCFSHHNVKAGGRHSKDPYAAAGSQRFSADVDSVCSMWQAKGGLEDDNPEGVIERNVSWVLRNGIAPARSFRLSDNADGSIAMSFDEPVRLATAVQDEDHSPLT